tara:strand:- start:316 stop:519 length:204 start_codon:yes stop_codon:yes gene_type:complete
MILGTLVGKLLKLLLPKVLDHLMQVFKLDKVLSYVEEDNILDHKVRDLEDKVIMLESKINKLIKKGK